MKHWADEFQPRSLCSFDGGPDGGDGDGGGAPPSDTGGDFFGSGDGSFFGTNDSGSFFGGDTAPASPTGGDSWTGSESGAGTFAASNSGGYFGGDTSSSGGGFIGGPEGGGGGEGGFIGPNSDFGYAPGDGWGPSGGVDFAGSSMGFGPAGAGNLGFGNAIGPAGWATGDFGLQGYGGPTGTGAGPGSTASIGGPQAYAQSPGINGFPGDFGAPPGGAFGMPGQGDVGPQAGPGMPGGPGTVGNAEPTGILSPAQETTPDVPLPDDRTEADPTAVFGPAYATNQAAPTAGWFGPSQAQAADRGTDQGIINAAMFANDFGRTGADMSQYMAATNPGLAQALSQIATNYQADPANDPANYAGPSPGAQQGFTGTSAQQGTTSFDSFGGKGDSLNQSSRADVQQTNPNFDQIGPMVTQQGYQQLAAEMNAQQPQTPTVQGPQQDTFDSRFNAVQSPQETISRGFDDLAGKPATSDTFDSRFGQMQAPAYDPSARPTAETQQDTFDSRFGNLPTNEQQQQLATDFGPNYGPSAPGLAQPGQLGPGMVMADPNVTPGQQQFGDAIPGTQFAAPSRGSDQAPPWSQGERGPIESIMETIGPQIGPNIMTQEGLGRIAGEAAPLGLWSMQNEPAGRPGGSPAGMPSVGPFGPAGRPGDDTSGRPGLSITVGNSQYAAGRPGGPGYYQTGGAGIAPGAKGAEYGGVYGRGDAYSTGRPGTNSFGAGGPGSWGAAAAAAARAGGGGGYFYDPATGQYYQTSRR